MTNDRKNWEERYDEQSGCTLPDCFECVRDKAFITSLLKDQKEEVREEFENEPMTLAFYQEITGGALEQQRGEWVKTLEGMKKPQELKIGPVNIKGAFDTFAYNKAISDMLSSLQDPIT